MGLEIIKTNNQNRDFIKLIALLDEDLTERYGDLQKQYGEHNKLDSISLVVVVYKDKVPVACGSFKENGHNTIELKRIFVIKEQRKQGLAKLVMNKLEELARDEGYTYAILETGQKQHEAIGLYKNYGYGITENYGPYIGNTNSICMKKKLC